ncbi:MAG: AraC family transcriptional regulator [Micropruina sp.]|uniref:helix-turn-helix transcriptional regulator n=1 Tax=Micropruina sp. TaxID=2737536 RepID=UPI0039E4DEDB
MSADTTVFSAGPTHRAGSALAVDLRPSDAGFRFLSDDDVSAEGHDAHRHSFHQFLFVPVGRAHVCADGTTHLLSPESGLWLPAGVWHSARFDPDSMVEPINFEASQWPLPFTTATPVAITTRRRRLLLAGLRGGADPGATVFSALLTEPRLPLPEPRTAAARAVAAGLRAEPRCQRTVADWAGHLHVGATTLRRAFVNETGLNFSEWRTRLRLNLSVDLLARGHLVCGVAQQVGFTSTNGFIIAFRRHFGKTPKAYAESELLIG